MRLVPYDKKKLGQIRSYKQTKNYEILHEFLDSGLECAKLEGWEYTSTKCCQNSLSISIKRFKIDGLVKVVIRGENIYLVRKNT